MNSWQARVAGSLAPCTVGLLGPFRRSIDLPVNLCGLRVSFVKSMRNNPARAAGCELAHAPAAGGERAAGSVWVHAQSDCFLVSAGGKQNGSFFFSPLLSLSRRIQPVCSLLSLL